MLDLLALQSSSSNPALVSVVYTVLLSFLLACAIGVTYERTFRGLSYSRNYVQALCMGSVVASVVMLAIGDNLARGLGMIGALAIIRFRTNFKDPRDILFMFASLAAGIACGVFAYTAAVVGTLAFCGIAVVLYFSPLGPSTYYDGMLRFNVESDPAVGTLIEQVLKDNCRTFALITLRDAAQGKRLDYAYHVKLRKGRTNAGFVEELRKIQGIRDISLMLQETTVEV